MEKTSVALDIETTGLDETRAELLSLSLIVESRQARLDKVPSRELPYLSLVVVKPTYNYMEPKAGAMNAKLLDVIADYSNPRNEKSKEVITDTLAGEILKLPMDPSFLKDTHYVTPTAALMLIHGFSKYFHEQYGEMELYGKNIAKFDLQVMLNFFEREFSNGRALLKEQILDKFFSYRYGDLGNAFWPYFKQMVSLSKIANLFGKKEVSHIAYEDGIDSVKAHRLAEAAFDQGARTLEELEAIAKSIN